MKTKTLKYHDTAIVVTRSDRETIALGINADLQIYVKAPLRCTDEYIMEFVESKSAWIEKHLAQRKQEQEMSEPLLSLADVQALADQALAYIPERVRFYAPRLGVTFGRITIRNQISRWGSCSSRGNLNFNCLLMLTPPEVIDYVVVHELCHRKEMNHSARFYALVESVLPDYKERKKWLKDNGPAILRRMTG